MCADSLCANSLCPDSLCPDCSCPDSLCWVILYPVCIYSCPVNLDVDCRLESRQAHVLDLDHLGYIIPWSNVPAGFIGTLKECSYWNPRNLKKYPICYQKKGAIGIHWLSEGDVEELLKGSLSTIDPC